MSRETIILKTCTNARRLPVRGNADTEIMNRPFNGGPRICIGRKYSKDVSLQCSATNHMRAFDVSYLVVFSSNH